jgi:hypothetical protein
MKIARSKKRYWIKEKKRGKRHEISNNQNIQEALTEYLEAYLHLLKEPGGFLCVVVGS